MTNKFNWIDDYPPSFSPVDPKIKLELQWIEHVNDWNITLPHSYVAFEDRDKFSIILRPWKRDIKIEYLDDDVPTIYLQYPIGINNFTRLVIHWDSDHNLEITLIKNENQQSIFS